MLVDAPDPASRIPDRGPGWYPDPYGPDGWRWWDGQQWGRTTTDINPEPAPLTSHLWFVGGIVAVGVLVIMAFIGMTLQ